MRNKASLLFLTFSILTSCGTIKIHDTKVCTVAGKLSAGANCTKAVSGAKTQITFEELIDMLEPGENRGPAVVIPMNDFVDLKTELESACIYLRCKKSDKKKLQKLIANLNELIGSSQKENDSAYKEPLQDRVTMPRDGELYLFEPVP